MRSKTQIDQHTVNLLDRIIQIDNLPRGRRNSLIQDLKTGLKHQVLVSQSNFLKNLQNRGLCTPEIRKLARRVIGTNNVRRNKAEQKRQLSMRVNKVSREVQQAKWNLRKSELAVRGSLSRRA